MRRARLGDPNLELRPSFKGQVVTSIIIPEIANAVSTTASTGVISAVISVDPVANVTNWATRFQALYEEFRVVKAKAVINFFSSTNPGQLNFFWNETASTSPTATAAEERTVRRIAAGSNQQRHVMTWTPHDLKDLQYSPTQTSVTPVFFNCYTDNASYGASTVATQYFTAQILVTVQFRGLRTT